MSDLYTVSLTNKSEAFLVALIDAFEDEVEELNNEIVHLKDEPRTTKTKEV